MSFPVMMLIDIAILVCDGPGDCLTPLETIQRKNCRLAILMLKPTLGFSPLVNEVLIEVESKIKYVLQS